MTINPRVRNALRVALRQEMQSKPGAPLESWRVVARTLENACEVLTRLPGDWRPPQYKSWWPSLMLSVEEREEMAWHAGGSASAAFDAQRFVAERDEIATMEAVFEDLRPLCKTKTGARDFGIACKLARPNSSARKLGKALGLRKDTVLERHKIACMVIGKKLWPHGVDDDACAAAEA